MKVIQIKDKNDIRSFELSLLPALQGFNFLIDLCQLLIDTPEVSAKSLIQLINNMALSGIEDKDAKKEQIEVAANKLLSPSGMDMSYFLTLLLGAIQQLDSEKREMLLTLTLKNVVFLNGEAKMKLSLGGDISTNVNNYINSPFTLLLLVKEFLTYNLMEIFSDFFTKTEANID